MPCSTFITKAPVHCCCGRKDELQNTTNSNGLASFQSIHCDIPAFPASLTRQYINPAAQLGLPPTQVWRPVSVDAPTPVCCPTCQHCLITSAVLKETSALIFKYSACYTVQGNILSMGALLWVTSWKRLYMALNKGESMLLKLHSLRYSCAAVWFPKEYRYDIMVPTCPT